MKHPLSVIWLDDPNEHGDELPSVVHTFTAEMDVGPSPQLNFPDTLVGKLTDISPVQLDQLKFRTIVAVIFSSRRYKFSQLDKDGTFELRKDW